MNSYYFVGTVVGRNETALKCFPTQAFRRFTPTPVVLAECAREAHSALQGYRIQNRIAVPCFASLICTWTSEAVFGYLLVNLSLRTLFVKQSKLLIGHTIQYLYNSLVLFVYTYLRLPRPLPNHHLVLNDISFGKGLAMTESFSSRAKQPALA